MSLFSNAVRYINNKKKTLYTNSKDIDDIGYVLPDQALDLDFSLRNYAKESFSVLIVNPLSKCTNKLLHGASFLVTGVLSGTVIAFVCCGILLQFNSAENSIVSSLVINRLEKLFEDADLSIKSAMINWNKDINSLELNLRKVKIDDLIIPRVTITPDYTESFKQHKLVAKTISLVKPKIAIDITDDLKEISFNPNLEKGNTKKVFFEPLSILQTLKKTFEGSTKVELIGADLSVIENGTHWEFKDVYCDYKLSDSMPSVLEGSIVLPKQPYTSKIKITRTEDDSASCFNVNLNSVNPLPLHNAFSRRSASLDKIMSFIEGYNLPVSGDLQFNCRHDRPLVCKFNLQASAGGIRLPNRNTLSLNLGKRIDGGNVSGSISSETMSIDSINIHYGNSGLQLTGLSVPMSDFKFLNIVNVDGTLSLTNIDVKEMGTVLPKSITKSVVPAFKTYLPGFKLDLFKIDLNGPVVFGKTINKEQLTIGQGIFKVRDAKIPLGNQLVTNVNALGHVAKSGIDIKLLSAQFGTTKINNGTFFISNDKSWSGDVNADVTVDDISAYSREISPRLAALPLDKLKIKGVANLDMKLSCPLDEKLLDKNLPFKIVSGEGSIKSDDNTKNLKISWSEKNLSVTGDVICGDNTIHLKIRDDFAQQTGTGEYSFSGNSEFLSALLPEPLKFVKGGFDLDLNTTMEGDVETYDMLMNLKDSVISIPALGDIKTSNEPGSFKAQVSKDSEKFVFSNISLNTKDAKIDGRLVLDKAGQISECTLDNFKIGECSAKINAIKKDENNMIVSIVGDSMDFNRMREIYNNISNDAKFNKDMKFSIYLNLDTLSVFNTEKVKNVKGTLDLLNKNIVNGACLGVLGSSPTTIALTAKDIDGNSSLLSISASNAGDFLKYIGFSDTVSGGSINFAFKSSKISDSSISGMFEVRDFIVKNNANLNRLISLSSTNWVSGAGNLVVGFNSCTGNFLATTDTVKIDDCRAISPGISISLEGIYDRRNDELSAIGTSLPMHSFVNNNGARGALAARYKLSGSLGALSVSVDPLQFISNNDLLMEFGNLASVLDNVSYADYDNADTTYTPIPTKEDVFAQKAFDRDIARNVVRNDDQSRDVKTRPIKKQNPQNKQKKTVDKKFGVTINRGLRS